MSNIEEVDEIQIDKLSFHGCIAAILRFILILLLLAGVFPYLPFS